MMARLIAAAVSVILLAYVAAVVFSVLAVGVAAYGLFRLIRYVWCAYCVARSERRRRRRDDLNETETGADEHRHRCGEVQDAATPFNTLGVDLPAGAR